MADTPLELPPHGEGRHIFNQYVVISEKRDALQAHLKSKGIGTKVYYPVPLHLQPCFAALGHKTGDMPHAERLAEKSLALPIFPELSEDEIRYVAAGISSFFS